MIAIFELMSWLSGLDSTGYVGVDKGAAALVEVRDNGLTAGACIEVGGRDEEIDTRTGQTGSAGVTAGPARTTAAPDLAVITVADLLEMVGGTLTRAELEQVRARVKCSSIGDSLGDVVFGVIEARRRELTDSVRAFGDTSAFAGCLGPTPLASVPAERIGSILTAIEAMTGLTLVRVRCGEDAWLGVEDPTSGRLFEIDDVFDAWLHGAGTSPGSTVHWIGPVVDSFTRDELIETGPHDYVLPETPGAR
ncbi:hypothetical protein OH799_11195 [Nocardia sp. NBC_00881]|uniref:hypothetical protein n=1 Tax=Nocardia sp. NBC_00881 TaxID=2975995 RepID=UPI003870DBEF|nr:hypothetical protein OH799_11195 [Nocardia sp. NBC_00881]